MTECIRCGKVSEQPNDWRNTVDENNKIIGMVCSECSEYYSSTRYRKLISSRKYREKHREKHKHPYIFDNCVDCKQPILFVNPLQIRCKDCHKVKQELYIEICRTRYNFDRLCDTNMEMAKQIEKEMIETDGEELRHMALNGIIKRKMDNSEREKLL